MKQWKKTRCTLHRRLYNLRASKTIQMCYNNNKIRGSLHVIRYYVETMLQLISCNGHLVYWSEDFHYTVAKRWGGGREKATEHWQTRVARVYKWMARYMVGKQLPHGMISVLPTQ